MFDKLSFNRNAFDRDVSSAAITSIITAAGSMKTQITVRSIATVRDIVGTGRMSCGIVMRQNLYTNIYGESVMTIANVILSVKIGTLRLSGSGYIRSGINVLTPFRGNLSGSGTTKFDSRFHMLQHIGIHTNGVGKFDMNLVMQSAIDSSEMEGVSKLSCYVSFPMSIDVDFNGHSDLILRRLNAFNENILELIDINLLPGDTVTIDTDLLQVLFGTREDVSSVTSDSIFFELSPGENELTISADSDTALDVVAIWQNRWL